MQTADLTEDPEIDVHSGDDPAVVTDDLHLHVATGDVFVFTRPGVDIPQMLPLSLALMSAQNWDDDPTFPETHSQGFYLLVWGNETVVYNTRFSDPFQFRAHIANSLGVQHSAIRLYPASPRVTNAAPDGQPCSTVVAVCEQQHADVAPTFGVLVDARAIAVGWTAVKAVAGRISCIACCIHLSQLAPEGLLIRLRDVPGNVDFLEVVPGQVLVATAESTAEVATLPAVATFAPVQSAGGSHTPPPGSTPDHDNPTQDSENHTAEVPIDQEAQDHVETADQEDPDQTAQHAETYATCSFIVLGQDYLPEHIVVRLQVGTRVADALHQVAAARSPQDAIRLPDLYAVHPQPHSTHALAVAVPAWNTDGAIVAIDCRSVDGRLSAIQLGSRVTRVDLLRAAQLDEHADIEVFPGSQPWPLPDDLPVTIADGDLIMFVWPSSRPHVISSLQDMLNSAEGWLEEFDPADCTTQRYPAATWIIGEDHITDFTIHPDRRSHIRYDIAALLGVSSRELVLQPAHLEQNDFCRRGRTYGTVLAAAETEGSLAAGERRNMIFFIDARPVLLGISWQGCVNGRIDTNDISARFAARCPSGWSVVFIRSDLTYRRPRGVEYVTDGQTLTIGFVPAAPLTNAGPHFTDPFDGRPDDDDRDSDDHNESVAGHDIPASSTDINAESADTGGTHHSSQGTDSFPGSGRVAMWLASICNLAVLAGTWLVTPVLPDHGSSTAAAAVCQAHAVRPTSGKPKTALIRCLVVLVLFTQSQVVVGGRFSTEGESQNPRHPSGVPLDHRTDVVEVLAINNSAQTRGGTDRRPLPTPCRAPIVRYTCASDAVVTGPDEGELYHELGDLETLLEESTRDPDCLAFWLASTLLETLSEHWNESASHDIVDGSSCAVAVGNATTISLAQALAGPQYFDLTHTALPTGLDISEVSSLLKANWVLPSDLHGYQLHPATKRWTQTLCSIALTEDTQYEIFSDGSFDGECSSWAFAVVASDGMHQSLVGWARGRVALEGSPAWIGARAHSAIEAEHSALFWATVWLLQANCRGRAHLYGDNTAALGQASGSFGGCDSSLSATACRAVAQAAVSAGCLSESAFHHVRAHCGHSCNELVDVIAKAQSRVDTSLPPAIVKVADWVQQGRLPWLWLHFEANRNPSCWPCWQNGSLIDKDRFTSPCPEPHRRFLGLEPSRTLPTSEDIWLDFRPKSVSVNVQTLAEDRDHGLDGRVPYVREQLEHVGATLIGLQETRSRQTETVVSQTHLRYTSAADNRGNYGVELWVSRTTPFAWRDKTPLFFQADDFRLLNWSPRHIIARVQRGLLRFIIAVCHAPTAADPTREAWWKTFTDNILNLGGGDPVVLLGDLNTKFVTPEQPHIGDLCYEKSPDLAGPLNRLLKIAGVWAPSTYSFCHHGASHTWSAPGGGSTSRIDYILIPLHWGVGSYASTVLHDVDFGQQGVDHYAVALDVQVMLRDSTCASHATKSIDLTRLRSPEAAEVVSGICQVLPCIPWSVDVHTHYDLFAGLLVQRLADVFPRSGPRRKRSFFTETTWSFRRRRTDLRRHIHSEAEWLSSCTTRWAWDVWAHGCVFVVRGVGILAQAIVNSKLLQDHVSELRSLKPLLRRSIQSDKRSYLKEVAATAVTGNSKCVTDKLRPLLGPPKRKRKGARAVPAILLEDGTVAPDSKSADDRWIRHFSAIEAGRPEAPEVIAENCIRRQNAADLGEVSLSHTDVPTRIQVETGLRSSPCDRAVGKDKVPADVLHCYPGQLSLPLYQLALKMAFRRAEPLQWKGGEMYQVWKRKGSVLDCSSYRAILVSSSIGKAIHSVFRRQCSEALDSTSTPMQVGGRRGHPVQLVIHAARLFQEAVQQRKKSSALIFVDLREAFHRVARPLVFGGPVSQRHVHSILAALGLSDEHAAELQAYVQQNSRIAEAGSSAWTADMLKEFGEDTWFALGRHGGTALVTSGTRPGDNLADMLFSFLFSSILKRLRCRFAEEGISVRLPWPEDWGIEQALNDTTGLAGNTRPVDITWMDDLALLVMSDTADDLVDKARRVATVTINECVRASLLPNLAAGKTEAVISLYGARSKKLAAEIFRGSEPSLQLHSHIWPEARLRLVSSYRHVGGIIQARGGHSKEIKARIGAAWAAFRLHKRQVFGSPVVDSRDKSLLFSSVVESTLFYGVGAWPLITEDDVAKFQHALHGMAKMMLRPKYDYDTASHLCPDLVIALARTLPARDAIHVERLRHLRSVAAQANSELCALLSYERSWLEHANTSLAWLQSKLVAGGDPKPPIAEWGSATRLAQEQPGVWKSLVKKARRVALLQARWDAERKQGYGNMLRLLKRTGVHMPGAIDASEPSEEACAVCQRTFANLRKWAVHAFKVHNRIREERILANGTQCPSCLRQYASNQKLGNHLRYNKACRQTLLDGGERVLPAPGVGSRRYDDGSNSQLPVVQAEGPTLPPSANQQNTAEPQRPEATILHRLTECFAFDHGTIHSVDELLEVYRRSLSSVCLQRSRLQATICAWESLIHDEISSGTDCSAAWIALHQRTVDALKSTDVVQWLVPDGAGTPRDHAVYRDAEVILPWLEPGDIPIINDLAVAGRCFSHVRREDFQTVLHSDCVVEPSLLDFSHDGFEARRGSYTVFDCSALSPPSAFPAPTSTFAKLEPGLGSMRLYFDLVNGLLFSWLKRQPALLCVGNTACPGVQALRQVAPVSWQDRGLTWLGNHRGDQSLSCFTSLITA